MHQRSAVPRWSLFARLSLTDRSFKQGNTMEIEQDFVFQPLPEIEVVQAFALSNPLGPLQLLEAKWKGHGFNQIWRPFHGSQDRFLELNLTTETLEFERIPGKIPNRGLLQGDITLFGLTYLQQIKDSNLKAGIHIEPGIWVTVPTTTNPDEPATVVRMASIPHGTSLVAQGTASKISSAPTIPSVSITPFVINQPTNLVHFPESDLATPSNFRSPPAQLVGITQAMVDNPNSVLQAALAGQVITETTTLKISSKVGVVPAPDAGGGVENIAFLTGNAQGSNALAAEIDATFWLETVRESSGHIFHQLQYSQVVLLNFNGLSWPHVSVATLRH
jgi:hypothetical protein